MYLSCSVTLNTWILLPEIWCLYESLRKRYWHNRFEKCPPKRYSMVRTPHNPHGTHHIHDIRPAIKKVNIKLKIVWVMRPATRLYIETDIESIFRRNFSHWSHKFQQIRNCINSIIIPVKHLTMIHTTSLTSRSEVQKNRQKKCVQIISDYWLKKIVFEEQTVKRRAIK